VSHDERCKSSVLNGAVKLIQSLLLAIIALSVFPASSLATEVTIYAGYRGGGDFEDVNTGASITLDEGGSVGVIVNVPYSRDTEMQFLYSTQSTKMQATGSSADNVDIDINYIQIGGTYLLLRDNFTPYFVATLGVVHFIPDGLSSENRFSFTLGGGAKIPFAKRFALNLEGRAYMTSLSGGGVMFCGNGQCSISASSSLFAQLEASAGLTFKF